MHREDSEFHTFDGRWRTSDGQTSIISGSLLTWPSGNQVHIKQGTSDLSMVHEGRWCTANLIHGRLVWNDQDIWTCEEPGPGVMAQQQPVISDGSRSQDLGPGSMSASAIAPLSPGVNEPVASVLTDREAELRRSQLAQQRLIRQQTASLLRELDAAQASLSGAMNAKISELRAEVEVLKGEVKKTGRVGYLLEANQTRQAAMLDRVSAIEQSLDTEAQQSASEEAEAFRMEVCARLDALQNRVAEVEASALRPHRTVVGKDDDEEGPTSASVVAQLAEAARTLGERMATLGQRVDALESGRREDVELRREYTEFRDNASADLGERVAFLEGTLGDSLKQHGQAFEGHRQAVDGRLATLETLLTETASRRADDVAERHARELESLRMSHQKHSEELANLAGHLSAASRHHEGSAEQKPSELSESFRLQEELSLRIDQCEAKLYAMGRRFEEVERTLGEPDATGPESEAREELVLPQGFVPLCTRLERLEEERRGASTTTDAAQSEGGGEAEPVTDQLDKLSKLVGASLEAHHNAQSQILSKIAAQDMDHARDLETVRSSIAEHAEELLQCKKESVDGLALLATRLESLEAQFIASRSTSQEQLAVPREAPQDEELQTRLGSLEGSASSTGSMLKALEEKMQGLTSSVQKAIEEQQVSQQDLLNDKAEFKGIADSLQEQLVSMQQRTGDLEAVSLLVQKQEASETEDAKASAIEKSHNELLVKLGSCATAEDIGELRATQWRQAQEINDLQSTNVQQNEELNRIDEVHGKIDKMVESAVDQLQEMITQAMEMQHTRVKGLQKELSAHGKCMASTEERLGKAESALREFTGSGIVSSSAATPELHDSITRAVEACVSKEAHQRQLASVDDRISKQVAEVGDRLNTLEQQQMKDLVSNGSRLGSIEKALTTATELHRSDISKMREVQAKHSEELLSAKAMCDCALRFAGELSSSVQRSGTGFATSSAEAVETKEPAAPSTAGCDPTPPPAPPSAPPQSIGMLLGQVYQAVGRRASEMGDIALSMSTPSAAEPEAGRRLDPEAEGPTAPAPAPSAAEPQEGRPRAGSQPEVASGDLAAPTPTPRAAEPESEADRRLDTDADVPAASTSTPSAVELQAAPRVDSDAAGPAALTPTPSAAEPEEVRPRAGSQPEVAVAVPTVTTTAAEPEAVAVPTPTAAVAEPEAVVPKPTATVAEPEAVAVPTPTATAAEPEAVAVPTPTPTAAEPEDHRPEGHVPAATPNLEARLPSKDNRQEGQAEAAAPNPEDNLPSKGAGAKGLGKGGAEPTAGKAAVAVPTPATTAAAPEVEKHASEATQRGAKGEPLVGKGAGKTPVATGAATATKGKGGKGGKPAVASPLAQEDDDEDDDDEGDSLDEDEGDLEDEASGSRSTDEEVSGSDDEELSGEEADEQRPPPQRPGTTSAAPPRQTSAVPGRANGTTSKPEPKPVPARRGLPGEVRGMDLYDTGLR